MEPTRLQEFFKYVSLNVAGMLAISLYIMVDTIFIAQALGNNGLAALNFAIPIYGVTHASGLMLGVGGAIKYNVYKTQGKQALANRVFSATILLGTIFALVFMVAGFFFYEDVARLLGARSESETFSMTADYLRVLLVFSPLYLANNILVGFIRNDNEPTIAMGGMVTSSVSNIGFDYLLLFVFPLGMLGAALATTFSAVLAFLYLMTFFIRKKNTVKFGPFKGAQVFWVTILMLGVSTFLVDFSYSVVMTLFNRILDGLGGTVAVAAYGIIANLSLLSISVFIGVSQGVQPLLTRAYSRGYVQRLRQNFFSGVMVVLALSGLIYSIFLIFGEAIVSAFDRDNDAMLQTLAFDGIRIYFVGLFFAGLNILYSAFFSAIERPRLGLLVVLLRGFVFIIPIALLFASLFEINGVWMSFVVAEGLTLVVAYGIFKVKASTSLLVHEDVLHTSKRGYDYS